MAKIEITCHVLVFTEAERDTILAALRFWQGHNQCKVHNRSTELHDIATNSGRHESLTEDELDALCERINCGDEDELEEHDGPGDDDAG